MQPVYTLFEMNRLHLFGAGSKKLTGFLCRILVSLEKKRAKMNNPIFQNLPNLVGQQGEKISLPNSYVRMLSLGGGGIRGILTLQILIALEKITGKPTRELFDMIVATSTGTIIAAALSTGIPAKDLQDDYINLSKQIFRVTPLDIGLTAPKYNAHLKLKLLQALLGKDLNMSDLPVPTYFTFTDLMSGEPSLFSSIPSSDADDYNLALAVNGATCPPPYFASQLMTNVKGDKTVNAVDGGLGGDNPAAIGLRIADTLFKGKEVAILSIGTGRASIKVSEEDSQRWGIIDWFTKGNLIEYFQDTVSDVVADNLRQFVGEKFLHINPLIPEDHDGSFDTECENTKALVTLGQKTVAQQCAQLVNFAKLLEPKGPLSAECPLDLPPPANCHHDFIQESCDCPKESTKKSQGKKKSSK